MGAEEISQQLRVLAAFIKDMGLVLSTHRLTHWPVTPIPGNLKPFSDFHGYAIGSHIYTEAYIYIHKIKKLQQQT